MKMLFGILRFLGLVAVNVVIQNWINNILEKDEKEEE